MVNTAITLYELNLFTTSTAQYNAYGRGSSNPQSILYIFEESVMGLRLVTTSTSTEGMYTSGPLIILRSQR